MEIRRRPGLTMVDVRAREAPVHEGALQLGPNWWLVVDEIRTAEDLIEELQKDADSVVDVSGWRSAFELEGDEVRDVLSTGCEVDLHPSRFAPGDCAQTLLARAPVILHCRATGFRVYARASFAAYVETWLNGAEA